MKQKKSINTLIIIINLIIITGTTGIFIFLQKQKSVSKTINNSTPNHSQYKQSSNNKKISSLIITF